MEIYRGSLGVKVGLGIPGIIPNIAGGDIVVAKQGNTTLHTFTSVDVDGNVTLPVNLVLLNREFYIHWDLDIEGTRSEFITDVEIVTPILPTSDIIAITGSTQDDAVSLERRVRKAIEGFTGTKFYPYKASVIARGAGRSRINLLDRLIKLDEVKFGDYAYDLAGIKTGLYHIEVDTEKWLTIKSDFHGLQNIIWPGSLSGTFSPNVEFTITGTWGYPTVPTDVVEAAKLLVNDYSCNDNVYRQRGVDVVSSPSMRLEFSDNAFSGTGNLDVDRLLSRYVRNEMYVI